MLAVCEQFIRNDQAEMMEIFMSERQETTSLKDRYKEDLIRLYLAMVGNCGDLQRIRKMNCSQQRVTIKILLYGDDINLFGRQR
jgi:hypothetical protein